MENRLNHVVAVLHKTKEPQNARNFLVHQLGFTQHTDDKQGWLVDNGTLHIRLLPLDPEEAPSRVHLEVLSNRLEKSVHRLTSREDVELRKAIHAISIWRKEAHLTTHYGFDLTLFHEYNEDELGILLPLSTSLEWAEEVQHTIQRILLSVPIAFREKARVEIVEKAEVRAAEDGEIEVFLHHALHACAQSTPLFQHRALREKMLEEGIDPTPFFASFTYDEDCSLD